MLQHLGKLLLFLLLVVNAGCVSTVIVSNYKITYSNDTKSFDDNNNNQIYKNGSSTATLSMECAGDYVYTGMLSPIIPLPPLVPFFYDDNGGEARIILTLNGSTFNYDDIKIEIRKFQSRHHIGRKVESNEKEHVIVWFIYPNSTCMELNNSSIHFVGLKDNDTLVELPHYLLNLIESGVAFDVEYLTQ